MKRGEASTTAQLCAFTRAYHSRYQSRHIYNDYLAYGLLGRKGYDRMKEQVGTMTTGVMEGISEETKQSVGQDNRQESFQRAEKESRQQNWQDSQQQMRQQGEQRAELRTGQEMCRGAVTQTEQELAGKQDPWYGEFLDRMIAPIILPRVRYAEERLVIFAHSRQAQELQEPTQYVICGAGLDSFAFRNRNPRLEIFELDHPDTQKMKLERIRQAGWKLPEHTHLVPIDFERQDLGQVLLQAGFRPERKTFIAILGVTYYLSQTVFAETLQTFGRLSEGPCQIVFDYPEHYDLDEEGQKLIPERMKQLLEMTDQMGETMKGGISLDLLRRIVGNMGFMIREHMTPARIQDCYFRNSEQMRAYENIHFLLLERREKMNYGDNI